MRAEPTRLGGEPLDNREPLDIRVVRTEREFKLAKAVRHEVFVVEQGIAPELEYDELDATSTHLLALDQDGAPIGTARMISGEPALTLTGVAGRVLLGRLAVLVRARGTGLGAALVGAVEQAGRELGATECELHAQVQALGFYERLGYAAEGPVYDDAGIPHRTMVKLF
ncbi:GNAT family N-acetyltransferase [Kitasatospora kifunensis]|uniref:Putative GNAT family N-acyltransferase n=1 Tax=Kitasatospora kifunensis TaxID=58351 RepID=A0A7W7VUU1_KITKI|nr:GNAT family N-acetyltransferase [Kitasatospora kifunensis]MBB4922830.1 putative GNAT family N-acyltransferase [Kitasatospora kifunensis]